MSQCANGRSRTRRGCAGSRSLAPHVVTSASVRPWHGAGCHEPRRAPAHMPPGAPASAVGIHGSTVVAVGRRTVAAAESPAVSHLRNEHCPRVGDAAIVTSGYPHRPVSACYGLATGSASIPPPPPTSTTDLPRRHWACLHSCCPTAPALPAPSHRVAGGALQYRQRCRYEPPYCHRHRRCCHCYCHRYHRERAQRARASGVARAVPHAAIAQRGFAHASPPGPHRVPQPGR